MAGFIGWQPDGDRTINGLKNPCRSKLRGYFVHAHFLIPVMGPYLQEIQLLNLVVDDALLQVSGGPSDACRADTHKQFV